MSTSSLKKVEAYKSDHSWNLSETKEPVIDTERRSIFRKYLTANLGDGQTGWWYWSEYLPKRFGRAERQRQFERVYQTAYRNGAERAEETLRHSFEKFYPQFMEELKKLDETAAKL